MNYPKKTLLIRPLRIAIMLSEVLIFFIISPAIILYTSGYRLNWHNWSIEQTGVISIDILPINASVSLNNIEILQKLPLRLTNRAPGTYHLKISAPGYLTWEKDITVASSLTTYIKQVSLFRQSVPVPILDNEKEKIISIYPSVDGQWILYVRENNDIFEINLLNNSTKKNTSIVRTKNFNDITVSWSPIGANAAINLEHDSKNTLYLFSAENTANMATWEYQQQKVEFVWSETSSLPQLYVKAGATIHSVSLQTNQPILNTPSTTIAWCVNKKNVLWQYDNQNKKFYTQDASSPSISFSSDEEITKILSCNEDRLLAQTHTSILAFPLRNNNSQLTKIHGTSLAFNNATQEWLGWSDSELWTLYTNNDTALLERTGEKITSVLPLDAYGVLLVETKNSLVAFNPGYYVSNTIFENGEIEKTAINQKERRILFLGTVGQKRGLYELTY